MTAHRDVAEAWSQKRKATGHNMFSEGDTVYSYGYHFPIAHHVGNNTVLFNTTRYSSSTTKHQSFVRAAAAFCCFKKIDCNTEQIKEAVGKEGEVIVIEKVRDPEDIDDIMECLFAALKRRGMKRVPRQKIRKSIGKLVVESAL